MPEYPIEFPCPALVGTIKLPQTFDVTDFEHSSRYRKKYTCDFMVEFEFIFDNEEIQQFMIWYKVNLSNGSRSFLADWNILGDTSQKEFHFDVAPEFEIVDKYYKMKAKFTVK